MPSQLTSQPTQHPTSPLRPTSNPFSCLEIETSPAPHDIDLNLHPLQTFELINIPAPVSQSTILQHINMTITDVPPNGDCFYNVIQLYLATLTEPVTTYIPQLRQQLANFLQNTQEVGRLYSNSIINLPI